MRRHEALVACPRVMRPGLTDVPCEADLLVAVQGTRDDGLWIEYEAPCQHTLTLEEEGVVLTAACDTLDRRYAEMETR